MKFGGTSVAGPEDLKRAAQRIVAAREQGNQVVAVLSARGKTTDELVDMAFEISERPYEREMDMLLSVGERISCALCAMAIHDMGHAAVSLTGSQAGIVTDSSHTKARILEVRADRIREALDRGPDRPRRRLPGRFGPEPRRHDARPRRLRHDRGRAGRRARRLGLRDLHRRRGRLHRRSPDLSRRTQARRCVSFDEMLEMSASGAGVLQLRSVEYARNHGVRIHCRSSFEDGPGTLVVPEDETMEQPDGHSRHAHLERGSGDRLGRRGRARRRRAHLRRARRRQRERRHDHPERAGLRRPEGRPLVHRRPRRAADRDRGDRGPRRGRAGRSPTSGSARSRSSAPA